MSSRSKDTGYLADIIAYDSSNNLGIGAAADGVNKLYVNGTIRQSVASSILKTDSTGKIVSAVVGTDYQAAGAVTSVTATSPIVSSGGATPAISIPASTTSVSGYLSSTDWNTFNNKQPALGFTAENVANKSTITTLGVSDTLYPTQNAVKTYVDNAVSVGIVIKQSVRVASTANVSISSAPAAIDGVTLTSTNRILLKDQTTTSQNGLYVFNGTGSALTRTTDMDVWSEVPKAGVFVSAGTINASSTWLTNVASTGTIDVTSIVWNQLSAATVYTAGSGLTLTGSQFSVTTAGITNAMLAGSIDLTSKVTGILPVANGGTGVSSITASRALVSDASSNVSVSATTSTELGYVSGVTSAIQTQINTKQATITLTTTGSSGAATFVSNTLNIPNYAYTLPTASTSVLGGVKVDGTSITIASGVISSTYSYSLPIASTTVLGGFMVGSNLSINATTGVLDATYSYSLPTASSSVLGGVKIGSGVSISSGTISVSTNYEPPITAGTASQYLKGDKTLGTFPTALSSFTNDLGNYGGWYSASTAGAATFSSTLFINGSPTTYGALAVQATAVGTARGLNVFSSASTSTGGNAITLTHTGTAAVIGADYTNTGGAFTPLILQTSNTDRLTIASTGAATFSSSVTTNESFSVVKSKSGTGVEGYNLLTLRLAGTGAIGDYGNIAWRSNDGSYTIATIGGVSGADNVAYGSISFSTRNFYYDALTEAMRIDNRGRVGIGTTNPADKLDVIDNRSNYGVLKIENDSASGYSSIEVFNSSGSQVGAMGYANASAAVTAGNMYTYSSGNITFLAGGTTERMRITSGGNVLINTTSSLFTGTFNVVASTNGGGDGIVSKTSTGTNSIPYFAWNAFATGNPEMMRFYSEATQTNRGGIYYDRANNAIAFSGVNAVELSIGGATQLYIPNTGNVLINTTTDAGYKLDVNGTGRFTGTVLTGAQTVGGMVTSTLGNNTQLFQASTATTGYQYCNMNNTSGQLIYGIESSTGGSVISSAAAYSTFIGTGGVSTAPLYLITNGIIRQTINGSTGAATFSGAVTISSSTASTSTTTGALIVTGGIGAGGSIYAASFFESSDKRVKTLIEDNFQAKGIETITPKLYIKKEKVELGYYAQDVQGILDGAVSEGEDGMLSLSYREVHTAKIYALELEIKELKELIKSLVK